MFNLMFTVHIGNNIITLLLMAIRQGHPELWGIQLVNWLVSVAVSSWDADNHIFTVQLQWEKRQLLSLSMHNCGSLSLSASQVKNGCTDAAVTAVTCTHLAYDATIQFDLLRASVALQDWSCPPLHILQWGSGEFLNSYHCFPLCSLSLLISLLPFVWLSSFVAWLSF